MRLANHYIGTFSIPENSHIGIILYDAFEIEIPMLIEFVKTGEDGRIEGRMALKEDAFAFSGTFVDNQIRAVCGTEDDRVRFVWKGSLAEGVLSGTYAGSHEGLRFKLRGIPNGIEGKWSCRACGDGMSDIPLRNQDPFEAQQGNGPDMEKPIAVETSSPSPDIASSLSLSMEGQRAGEARVFGGIEMVWCPPGSFMMGSPPFENGRAAMETPHGVTLTEGFWMATSATTQEQWMGGSPCNPSTFQGMGLPVHNVTWENCHEWLGKMNRENLLSYGWEWSLPTEAQWEYACRAGTGTEFSFGSSLNGSRANCDGRIPYGTCERGPFLQKVVKIRSYAANAWGLHDMHGNVYEWCRDWHGPYPNGFVIDPEGPSVGTHRVCRGGNWKSGADRCRSAWRYMADPNSNGSSWGSIGFRVVAVRSSRKNTMLESILFSS